MENKNKEIKTKETSQYKQKKTEGESLFKNVFNLNCNNTKKWTTRKQMMNLYIEDYNEHADPLRLIRKQLFFRDERIDQYKTDEKEEEKIQIQKGNFNTVAIGTNQIQSLKRSFLDVDEQELEYIQSFNQKKKKKPDEQLENINILQIPDPIQNSSSFLSLLREHIEKEQQQFEKIELLEQQEEKNQKKTESTEEPKVEELQQPVELPKQQINPQDQQVTPEQQEQKEINQVDEQQQEKTEKLNEQNLFSLEDLIQNKEKTEQKEIITDQKATEVSSNPFLIAMQPKQDTKQPQKYYQENQENAPITTSIFYQAFQEGGQQVNFQALISKQENMQTVQPNINQSFNLFDNNLLQQQQQYNYFPQQFNQQQSIQQYQQPFVQSQNNIQQPFNIIPQQEQQQYIEEPVNSYQNQTFYPNQFQSNFQSLYIQQTPVPQARIAMFDQPKQQKAQNNLFQETQQKLKAPEQPHQRKKQGQLLRSNN